jgi:hypothetical protein
MNCEICQDQQVVDVGPNPYGLSSAFCVCCNLNITLEDLDFILEMIDAESNQHSQENGS